MIATHDPRMTDLAEALAAQWGRPVATSSSSRTVGPTASGWWTAGGRCGSGPLRTAWYG